MVDWKASTENFPFARDTVSQDPKSASISGQRSISAMAGHVAGHYGPKCELL